MKTIQIFGPGCSKCKKLAEVAEEAAKSAGIEYQIEKITDINVMVGFHVMSTPAMAVDGLVKVSGRIPSLDELKGTLS